MKTPAPVRRTLGWFVLLVLALAAAAWLVQRLWLAPQRAALAQVQELHLDEQPPVPPKR